MAQPGGDALTQRSTVTAGDNDRLTVKRACPRSDIGSGSAQRARDEERFGREFFVRSNIYQDGPGLNANQANELIR
jgi:hypothetical protein